MQMFGSTLKETKKSIKANIDKKMAYARIVISMILLVLAIILIFYSDKTADIGEFLLGAIVGYWLK